MELVVIVETLRNLFRYRPDTCVAWAWGLSDDDLSRLHFSDLDGDEKQAVIEERLRRGMDAWGRRASSTLVTPCSPSRAAVIPPVHGDKAGGGAS